MKKRLVIAMCCGMMILENFSGCGTTKTAQSEYHWPTSALAESLPVPESKYGEVVLDTKDSFEINVFEMSKEQFADYMDACKDNGFTEDYYATDDSYDAENKDGYTLSLSYDEKKETMNIDVYELAEDSGKPEDTEDIEDTEAEKDTGKDTSENSKKKTGSKKKEGAVSADFKKMMDSYEAFFDKYIKFMKKYENSDDVAGMLGDYADYMTKYADYMQKLDDIDTDELSAADAAYYAEVQARIVKKLAEIQ